MSPIDLPKIYNPHNQTRDELIGNFVVRLGLFRDIFEDIRTSKMVHPEQHYIIQGVRGQGKTSLLLRIAYEIEKDKTLNNKIIPVIFNEEQYKIRKLFKLWEETALYLKNHQGFENLYKEMQNLEFDEDFEEKSFRLLERTLQKNKKKLILFIDNIADMLHKFKSSEHWRLREILIESAEIRIIGASAESLEFHHDYSKPFYRFFKMPILKGLNQKETNTLLLSLGEKYKRNRVRDIVKNESGRVEALRRMTGGVIRTIVILYQIFVDDENGNAFQDLETILDEVTPLYKHRMEVLSPQQQEIVDIIALNWDAISTKEIADKAREQSKAISAQLNILVNNYIIEKQDTKTKNYLYRLSERFFNIWYLMRYGGKEEELKVKWLVEFLLCWCDEKTLIEKTERHMNAIQCGEMYEKHALYVTEALRCTLKNRELQDKLVQKTRKYLESKKSDLLEYLHPSDSEVKQKAFEYFKINDLEQTVKDLEKIRVKTGDDYNLLGDIYLLEKSDFPKAEKYYLLAIEKEKAGAMFNLALLYHTEFKEFQKAEKYYLMAAEHNIVNAWNAVAWMYYENSLDKEKALKYVAKGYKKKNIFISYTYSMILLWNNEIEKALEISNDFLLKAESYEKFSSDIRDFLMLLIAKKQYHSALRIFQENPYKLNDRFKPIYYALMYFLQDEYPNEYIKMGSELKQTVKELIEEIGKFAVKYE